MIIYYCVFGVNEMDLCSKVKFLQSLNHWHIPRWHFQTPGEGVPNKVLFGGGEGKAALPRDNPFIKKKNPFHIPVLKKNELLNKSSYHCYVAFNHEIKIVQPY